MFRTALMASALVLTAGAASADITFTGAGPAEAAVDTGASTAANAQGATVTITTTGRLVVAFGEGADFTPGNMLVVS